MRRMLLVIALLTLWGIPACNYTKQRWQTFTEDVRKTAAQPRTKEGICQSRGGILYEDQCYTPSPNGATLDKETCRIRGGLFVDEECLFVPPGNSALMNFDEQDR